MSKEECGALISLSEAAGYAGAPIEGEFDGPFGFRVHNGRRNCRAAVEDRRLADVLWERLKRHVPGRVEGRAVVGLNERLRFYRYEAGHHFSAHTDGYYLRANGERSRLTLMVYLNENFTGGQTFFLQTERTITPQTGTLLLFSHHLWHAGRPVLQGRKYVLRTDVMYEAFSR